LQCREHGADVIYFAAHFGNLKLKVIVGGCRPCSGVAFGSSRAGLTSFAALAAPLASFGKATAFF
jgi:hypothetical protein